MSDLKDRLKTPWKAMQGVGGGPVIHDCEDRFVAYFERMDFAEIVARGINTLTAEKGL